MTREAARLLEEALQLPEDDRARIAGELLQSLHEPAEPLQPEEYESLWSDEIARRLEAVDAGAVKPVPWTSARSTIASNE